MSLSTWEPSSELPQYSPPSPSPFYSCQLLSGERLLEHTPRSRTSGPPPTSVIIRRANKATVVLHEQEEGAHIPTYGRHGLVSGAICLEEPHSIMSVVVKIIAKLDTTTSEGGSQIIQLVNERNSLWPPSTTSQESQGPCPAQLTFSMILPATFKYENEDTPLPPTYHKQFIGHPGLVLRSVYQLHVVITRVRHRKVDFWPKKKRIVIPFVYSPRTRPHRPIVPTPCFFSSIKTSPEEWYQAVTTLKVRPNATIDPITCHFFVPGGRIYGLGDSIPFHIQLSGSTCSLQKAFQNPLQRVLSSETENTIRPEASDCAGSSFFHVKLLRQIAVNQKGSSSWRNVVLGQGTVSPIPPDLSDCCLSNSGCVEGHADWEGEVQCSSDVTVGSFNVANIHVKDFIVMTLSPPNSKDSPLQEMQVTVPVRLVTDSFSDSDTSAMDTIVQ